MKSKPFTLLLLLFGLTAHTFAQTSFDGEIKNNSLAINASETIAATSYSDKSEVKIYDLVQGNLKTTIEGFINPRNIVFSPDGKELYITDSSLGYLLVYDTAAFKLLRKYPVGYGAFGTTLSQDGQQLYINNEAASTVTVLHPTTGDVGKIVVGFNQPRQGVKLSPDQKKLYVTNFGSDRITIVDVKTLKIVGEINGFKKIRAISISKNGKTLFAANSGSNELLVVNLSNKKITHRIPVGQDNYGATLSPDGKYVLSGNKEDDSVSVVDVKAKKTIHTIKGFKEPRQAIVFTKDGNYFYVLNSDLSIDKVSMDSYSIIQSIH